MSLSDYAEAKIVDHSLGTTAWTMPSTVYAALFTTDPTDAASGSEVSGGAYARVAITFAAAAPSGTKHEAASNADVEFPVATASWGTVTHVGLFDASSGGNMIWSGALTTSKLISIDDQFVLKSGQVKVNLD